MPPASSSPTLRIGVDVGGTFTDLVATNGNDLHIIKIPSTPPDFHKAVIEAVQSLLHNGQLTTNNGQIEIIHGSTVATNALLQRAIAPIAFITTKGFRDLLLIGRQNRPDLYALHVLRPPPVVPSENCFTIPERIDANGEVVMPLDDAALKSVIAQIQQKGLKSAAVCFLFSFINPAHEQLVQRALEKAGITCTLSSEVLPEFREYERASTTAINAALRPVVHDYLTALETGLSSLPIENQKSKIKNLRIMHSSGGTLPPSQASTHAARLLLSGPAGGVQGAAYVAQLAGFSNVITYDMGGTSTDVAVILNGQPQWTTTTTISGLPVSIPMFDINTVGAGGGSIAALDTGGSLRVGPTSAGAFPGPACYARGGTNPTVTDANVLLGRILPDHFLGGAMKINPTLAHAAIEKLAAQLNKTAIETAHGIIKIANSNMEHALRSVTTRRGHDPRDFTLLSFGGTGGLHACDLARALEIPRVLIPPYCGVLSALGMIVAPAVSDASKSVVHLAERLDDDRLAAEFGSLSAQTIDEIPYEQTATTEVFADVRFKGQSHELKVQIHRPSKEEIQSRFHEAYTKLYGNLPTPPSNRQIEIVTLRVRRTGKTLALKLPELSTKSAFTTTTTLINADGTKVNAPALNRPALLKQSKVTGPAILLDPEATAYVPPNWIATARADGSIVLERD